MGKLEEREQRRNSALLCIRILFLVFFCLAAEAEAAEKREYEVVVAGGGMGGIAAAIQAARLGASVLVVEPSDWIGGQATAAGVSTMDDLSRQSSGLYLEFISRLRRYYDSKHKSMGTCYWDARSVAFEPFVGQKALYEMLQEARASGADGADKSKKTLDVRLNASVTQVKREGVFVTGVTVSDGKSGAKSEIKCRVLIDATEYGDVLPLARAGYRIGNSVTPFINQDAMIQDITWAAVIRHYPGGVPPHLRARRPLPGYEEARRNYESYVTADGQNFKGVYPVRLPINFVTHNAYRGLPDSVTPWSYDGQPQNWKYIAKSAVNWGNDYPGKDSWNGRSGLPARYLEDPVLRARVEKDAFLKTLHFIYYIQNELGENWSVADDEYEHASPPAAAEELPADWREIARRMPPVPYVRESRRAVGDYTLTSSELLRNSLSYRDGQTSHEFGDAIAIGGYILDLHGANTDSDMEWEMGEKAASVAANRPRGPFQVPLRILIPRDVEGLLAAEKNLSMSRLAAGALRLQPICMMVGQAAGALAALSAKAGVPPREVPPVKVQRALLDAGVALSLCKYSDVPPEHPFYGAVQLSNLYGLLSPLEPPHAPSYNISDLDDPVLAMAIIKGADKGVFGVDELLSREDMISMLNKARAASKTAGGRDLTGEEWPEATFFVSRGMFSDAVFRAFGFRLGPRPNIFFNIPSTHRFAEPVRTLDALGILNVFRPERDFRPARPLTRGEAADIVMRAMTVN
ncbi:MAG: FAD-dependent oxidoreductase [Synergistaceae bacterium]|nr:FAD-dependent oxidoreductase [Synergistaceae bacterium]